MNGVSFNFNILSDLDSLRESRLRIGGYNLRTPIFGLNNSQFLRLRQGYSFINQTMNEAPFVETIIDYDSNSMIPDDQYDVFKTKISQKIRRNQLNFVRFRPNGNINNNIMQNMILSQSNNQNVGIIMYPDPVLKEFNPSWRRIIDKALETSQDSIETGRKVTQMPIISLDQRNTIIEQKLDYLLHKNIESIGFEAVGSVYSQRLDHSIQKIRESENNIWIHLTGLKKDFLKVSQAHLAPLKYVDTISLNKKRGVSFQRSTRDLGPLFGTPEGIPLDPQVNQETHQNLNQNYEDVDIFEGNLLGFIKSEDWENNYVHDSNCQCPIHQRARQREEFLNNVRLIKENYKNILFIHEYIDYLQEFEKIRNSIHDNEVENYYNSKSLVMSNINELRTRFPIPTHHNNQTQLEQFY